MESIFERSELLLGKGASDILSTKKVAVIGVGGVGGYVVEGLTRSGVGSFFLLDSDKVNPSNINRQIIALHSNVGKYKTHVLKERMLDINPSVIVETSEIFYLPNNANVDFSNFDMVVDCIDTVSAKLDIAKKCYELNVPLISSMGTGNKFNPLAFEITDINKTSVCPLAKVMRRELKKMGVPKLTVLYSKEEPKKAPPIIDENGVEKRAQTGSLPYVPSVAGLVIASYVVKELLK